MKYIILLFGLFALNNLSAQCDSIDVQTSITIDDLYTVDTMDDSLYVERKEILDFFNQLSIIRSAKIHQDSLATVYLPALIQELENELLQVKTNQEAALRFWKIQSTRRRYLQDYITFLNSLYP